VYLLGGISSANYDFFAAHTDRRRSTLLFPAGVSSFSTTFTKQLKPSDNLRNKTTSLISDANTVQLLIEAVVETYRRNTRFVSHQIDRVEIK
jgi:hypothetical protein